MVFWITEIINVINFLLAWCFDVMTSCHDVTKPDLPISACWCARTLILFLFLCFFGSLSSLALLISDLLDVLTSWRHAMTSQNLIYLFQFVESVDVLESLFFSRFYGFTSDWDDERYYFFIFMWYRDVMTSCHDVTKSDLPISACRGARKLILFLFLWFFRSLSSKMYWIFHLFDVLTLWRHAMTSCNAMTSWKLITHPSL